MRDDKVFCVPCHFVFEFMDAPKINSSQSKVKGNYASVTEQSGLNAGDGGFQLKVKGNTDLKGGVIASSDSAIAEGKNTFATATLTQSDLQNRADASASSSGMSLSSDMMSQGKYGIAKGVMSNLLNNASESGSSSGQTRSAVSAGTVTITNDAQQQALTGKSAKETVASLNRDTENAQVSAIKQDAKAMAETVEAVRAIKQEGFKQITAVTADLVYKAATADKKIMLVQCDQTGKCADPHQVDAKDVKVSGGTVNVYNNGINNSESEAIENAKLQSSSDALNQGVYVVVNPLVGGRNQWGQTRLILQ